MMLRPWLQFFRLPNLPTAPGDALAGAVMGVALTGGDVRHALVAGAAALFLYMYGLADNDIVGAKSDEVNAPERPIPRGEISLRSARIARSTCLFLALVLGALFNLPSAWWMGAVVLTGLICLYNRVKSKWLMGLCRGASLLCGVMAVARPSVLTNEAWKMAGHSPEWTIAALVAMVFGWTLYIAAVTKISEGEESASEGLGKWRFVLGLSALVPLIACAAFPNPRQALLPLIGGLWTFVSWCAAVAPLGEPHESAVRRAAVGRMIGALLYLQIGFMLVTPHREFLAVAIALWLAARFIRRFASQISGS